MTDIEQIIDDYCDQIIDYYCDTDQAQVRRFLREQLTGEVDRLSELGGIEVAKPITSDAAPRNRAERRAAARKRNR